MQEQIKRFYLFSSFFLIMLLIPIALIGCKKVPKDPITKSSFMLNTVITITIYDSSDESILDKAFELCKDYENQLSMTLANSEVSKMNHRGDGQTTFTVNKDIEELLEKSIYYSELSNGAFDITIAPLSSLWNFTATSPKVPDKETIEALLPSVNYHNLKLENGQLTFLSPDTRIDLGAIAKGFIADKLKDYLKSQGVKSALINLGGNVLCVGSKPDGTPFKVGIQKPFKDRNEVVGALNVQDMTVVSSGIYERCFVEDDVNYHHLLDVQTGYPIYNGLTSITILCEKSVDGDGLSTTAFALGLEEGLELINSLENVYAIFITEDGTLHYTEGVEEFIVK